MSAQYAKWDIASLTDVGLKRQKNEDFCIYHLPPEPSPWGALFLVADGMGAMGGGDVASRTAAETLVQHYYAATVSAPTAGSASAPERSAADIPTSQTLVSGLAAQADPMARLLDGLEAANVAVREQAETLGRARIGTTAAGLVLLPDAQGLVFNVGDSRVYRIRQGTIEQISHDQSVVQMQLDAGVISEAQAREARNVNITAFLGQDKPIEPVMRRIQTEPGDVYILCSDGLWDLVEKEAILKTVRSSPAKQAAQKLLKQAYRGGAHDNVTIQIVRLGRAPRRIGVGAGLAGLLAVGAIAAGVILALGDDGSSGGSTISTPDTLTPSAVAISDGAASSTPAEGIDQIATSAPTAANGSGAVLSVHTLTPSHTATPSATATASATSTVTPTPPPSATPTVTATVTATASRTPTPTITATASATPTATTTATRTVSPTPSRTATATASATVTASPTPRPSRTPTATASATLTPSATPSRTPTPTPRPSATPSPTPSATPSRTPTPTVVREPTVTLDPRLISPTPSPVPSPTPTLSPAEQILQLAESEGVLVPAGMVLYVADSSGVQLDAVTLDAETHVKVIAGEAQTDPERDQVRLLPVSVQEGPEAGTTGWIAEDVLGASDPVSPYAIINDTVTEGANIRLGDDTRYQPIGALFPGERAPIVGRSRGTGWYQLRLPNNRLGWIAPSLVMVIGRLDEVPYVAPPPSPTPSATPLESATPEETPTETPLPDTIDNNGL